jgi:hypothetical protein
MKIVHLEIAKLEVKRSHDNIMPRKQGTLEFTVA